MHTKRPDRGQTGNAHRLSGLIVLTLQASLLLACSVCWGQQSQQAQGSRQQNQIPQCLPCHGVEGFSIQAQNGNIVDLSIDPERYRRSVHGRLQCYQCHVNMAIQPHAQVPIRIPGVMQPYVMKWRSDLRPAAAGCIGCHSQQFEDYSHSVHAQSLRRGSRAAPFCSECHGSHYIMGSENLESEVSPQNVPDTCASCHEVGLIMRRQNIPTNTVQTFRQSVHGRKLLLGEEDVAVCTSCHGVHDIRSHEDPESRLHPDNIVATCRVCHEGASLSFALSFRHATPSRTVEPIVYYVQAFYRLLLYVIIGGMSAYVLIDLLRRFIAWGRRRAGGPP